MMFYLARFHYIEIKKKRQREKTNTAIKKTFSYKLETYTIIMIEIKYVDVFLA
jgi:hypothetical protein